MNQLEQEKIRQLLGDELLVNILKKLFSQEVDKHRPEVNAVDDDKVLGQKHRAYIEAKHIISECFAEMESYKIDKVDKKILNKAR